MKYNEKRNMISAIQQNLKEMQQEAQQFIEKHHVNLPPICSARHYLLQTIKNKSQNDASQSLGQILSRNGKQQKTINSDEKTISKQMESKAKTSVYNLQFVKKAKPENNFHQNKSLNVRTSLMNSTSLKLRMSGHFRSSRYMESISSRTSIEVDNNQKLKTIIMNSQIIGLAEKDLKINLNQNSFSPKLGKLDLPKKQTEVLQKYLSKFKQNKSQQIRASPPKLEQLANKSSELLEGSLPQDIIQQQHCLKRKRRLCFKTIDNPESGVNKDQDKDRLEKQLLRRTRVKKSKSKQMKQVQEDYTPWGFEDKNQEGNFDFS